MNTKILNQKNPVGSVCRIVTQTGVAFSENQHHKSRRSTREQIRLTLTIWKCAKQKKAGAWPERMTLEAFISTVLNMAVKNITEIKSSSLSLMCHGSSTNRWYWEMERSLVWVHVATGLSRRPLHRQGHPSHPTELNQWSLQEQSMPGNGARNMGF